MKELKQGWIDARECIPNEKKKGPFADRTCSQDIWIYLLALVDVVYSFTDNVFHFINVADHLLPDRAQKGEQKISLLLDLKEEGC